MRNYIGNGLINQCTTTKKQCFKQQPLTTSVREIIVSFLDSPAGFTDSENSHVHCTLRNELLKSECKHVREGLGVSEAQKSKVGAKFLIHEYW